jgi:hypothetical protein
LCYFTPIANIWALLLVPLIHPPCKIGRCTVAKQVAKEKVKRICGTIPMGPIGIGKRTDGSSRTRSWMHFGGTNNFSLRAPVDKKAWVSIYHYVEKILRKTF